MGNEESPARITRRKAISVAATGVLASVASSNKAKAAPKLAKNLRRLHSSVTPLKKQAMSDYVASMSAYGGRLANPHHHLRAAAGRDEFIDVLIIGSGYGGAITASRLAQQIQPGRRVVVLERGREWLPGTFPDSLTQATSELRNGFSETLEQGTPHKQFGLLDVVYSKDMNVMSGNALGGTSIINANVACRPDREVFMQTEWPDGLFNRDILEPHYNRVAWELNLNQMPHDTRKSDYLYQIAKKAGASSYPADLTVSYEGRGLDASGRNRQGVYQRPCTQCGDCTTGCNVGAKNTLQVNYLPMAKRHGAELYTQTEVDFVEKAEHGYRVHFKQFAKCGSQQNATCGTLRARVVILAAGSLGTTGILLRSRQRGLPVSDHLGCHFSGNGDVLGLIVGGDCKNNAAGLGAYQTDQEPVGTAQQRHLDLRHLPNLRDRLLIQEGLVPRAYATAAGAIMRDPNLERTMLLLIVGHDGASGRIVLKKGKTKVLWPELKGGAYQQYTGRQVERLARAAGGRAKHYHILQDKPVTVHPLGGCRMADDPSLGVTTDLGHVFDPTGSNGTNIHDGLFVADGALIPTSLGANPFFTISALAERIAESIATSPQHVDLFRRAA